MYYSVVYRNGAVEYTKVLIFSFVCFCFVLQCRRVSGVWIKWCGGGVCSESRRE